MSRQGLSSYVPTQSIQYRSEIDGLRAVSVLLVVLNHAAVPPFGGGFIGVDVFFVISGYLITSIILQQRAAGVFSYRQFVARRFRRIIPALFLLFVVVTVFAHFALVEQDRVNYFQSLIAAVTFWPNIYFWLDTGYFDSGAIFKPLLHTWSLGVEEHFYLAFPVLLVMLAKLPRSSIRLTFVVLAAGSFLLMSLVDSDARFFLLPFRAWELLVGAICAVGLGRGNIVSRGDIFGARPLARIQSLVGLALIVVSGVIIDKGANWPSALTLLPVVGSVLVIADMAPESYGHRILSLPAMVSLGLWSYSIYLWHQPIFALTRYWTFGEIGIATKAFLVGFSVGIGWLSWRYVEQTFRTERLLKTRHLVFSAAAVGTILVGLAIWVVRADSYSIVTREYASIREQTRVVLVGDSHASHLVSGLSESFSDSIELSASAGCVPFWGVDRYDSRFTPGDCAEFMETALGGIITASQVEVVVLASMGPVYISGEAFRGYDLARVTGDGMVLVDKPAVTDRGQVFEIGMKQTVHRLLRSGKEVIFVIDVPELGLAAQMCRPAEPQTCENTRSSIDARNAEYRTIVSRVAGEFPALRVFDPTDLFCDEMKCQGIFEGQRLYMDGDHLSEFGSKIVGAGLAQLINQALDIGAEQK
ncbi:MAG: acyltransferase family protein [Ilumatobacteraceae bacterium]